MAKKPTYSQGEYIVRKRSRNAETYNYSPWSYFSKVFSNFDDADYFIHNEYFPMPENACMIEVEVIDFEGKCVSTYIDEYC